MSTPRDAVHAERRAALLAAGWFKERGQSPNKRWRHARYVVAVGLTLTEAEVAEAAEVDPRRRETPPVLAAARVGATLVVVCPYCGQQHAHGVGDGPRAPHCGDHTGPHSGTPRPELGPYVLVEERG